MYLKQNNTVPSPNVRLAGFERVHLQSKHSKIVDFSILPEWHSVVLDGDSTNIYVPTLKVPQGSLEIFVGGGQPDYYKGHLRAVVQIQTDENLLDCPSYKIK